MRKICHPERGPSKPQSKDLRSPHRIVILSEGKPQSKDWSLMATKTSRSVLEPGAGAASKDLRFAGCLHLPSHRIVILSEGEAAVEGPASPHDCRNHRHLSSKARLPPPHPRPHHRPQRPRPTHQRQHHRRILRRIRTPILRMQRHRHQNQNRASRQPIEPSLHNTSENQTKKRVPHARRAAGSWECYPPRAASPACCSHPP